MPDSLSDWPKLDLAEVEARLIAPGAPYEMELAEIRGRKTRVYRNARPHLRSVFDDSLRFAEREFLVYGDERLTFGEHWRAATALGRVLAERFGVGKGDRVALCLRNYPEWSIAAWATIALGAVLVPLNAWGNGAEIAHGIRDSEARVLFADAERIARLEPHLADLGLAAVIGVRAPAAGGVVPIADLIGVPSAYVELPDAPLPDPGLVPEDDATLFYTSGTTAAAKGALGTHRNVMTNLVSATIRAARAALRQGKPPPPLESSGAQRTVLLAVPLFHVTGFHAVLLPALTNGSRVLLMYKWEAAETLRLIERERVNAMTGVPAMYWQLLAQSDLAARDVSSLDTLGYGGASAGPELTTRLHAAFPRVALAQGYGATEASSLIASLSGEDLLRAPGSVGLPVPVCDVKIMAPDRLSESASGEAGELWARGPNIVRGYWNDAVASAATFVDGWYVTGDIVRIDADGFIHILDRVKDIIIRGGENIHCVEIEDALRRHPAVADACVFGLPHPVLGESVAAMVELNPGAAVGSAELETHTAAELPLHKRPTTLVVADKPLPRNAAGKVLKRALKADLTAQFERETLT